MILQPACWSYHVIISCLLLRSITTALYAGSVSHVLQQYRTSYLIRYSSCRYNDRQLIDVTVVRRVRPRVEHRYHAYHHVRTYRFLPTDTRYVRIWYIIRTWYHTVVALKQNLVNTRTVCPCLIGLPPSRNGSPLTSSIPRSFSLSVGRPLFWCLLPAPSSLSLPVRPQPVCVFWGGES